MVKERPAPPSGSLGTAESAESLSGCKNRAILDGGNEYLDKYSPSMVVVRTLVGEAKIKGEGSALHSSSDGK
jgi:hypothetical protein